MLLACCAGAFAQDGVATAQAQQRSLGHAVLRELVGIDTTPAHGSTTVAAERLAQRFLDAGFPAGDVDVVGAGPRTQNLVVRLRGSGAREPVLLIAHLDVVEALREDWTVDPYVLTERDGYFYGRGTMDIKGGAAALVAALLRLHREGVVPRGDYVLALTAGEEDGVDNGIQWLLEHRPDWMRAGYVVNVDGGGVELRDGVPSVVWVNTAEKVYLSYTLTARNPGGHSSQPGPGNAIYQLANALVRVERFRFPLRPNSATRGFFGQVAMADPGAAIAADARAVGDGSARPGALERLAAQVHFNAQLRTTCVPTLLQGGHAENALPQSARATINCRLLPDEDPAQVDAWLRAAIDDPGVVLERVAPPNLSPPTAIDPALFDAFRGVARSLWPGVEVAPNMAVGASDSVFLRAAGVPVYVFYGLPQDPDDDRSHGQDERISVDAFDQSLEFTYRLLKAL